MNEVIFLFTLGLIWIIFATIEDLRTREISNWLNFSLIIFALGFRFFYSLFEAGDFSLFYQGLIGYGIFFVLGNLLYYSRMFAGGDAKLMISLGAILPIFPDFISNLKLFFIFFMLFLVVGAIYGLFRSITIGLKNFDKFEKVFQTRMDTIDDIARKSPLSPAPQREKLHNLLMECLEHEFGSEEKIKQQVCDYVSAKDVMDKLELIEKKIK